MVGSKFANVPLFRVQQSKKFRAWNEKLSTQHPARLQFSPLDKPIDAEIIHAQHLSGFAEGIGDSFVWCFSYI